MKTTMIIKRCVQAILLGAALTSAAMAQPGPGWGGGWCGGPGMQRGMGGPGGGRGMGYGMGPGAWAGQGTPASQNLTRGRDLMTPQERTDQQIKMRSVKTYDECVAVQTQHRGMLETRAKEKGLTLLSPPFSPCDNLKARGLIK